MRRTTLFLLALFLLVSTALISVNRSTSAEPADTAALPVISIPVRWCIMDGAPSENNPGLVGEATVKDLLWRRHERVTDNIYNNANVRITLRSGATAALPAFPVLTDMNISPGSQPGDVLDSDFDSGAEFNAVINQCRTAWTAAAPAVTGLTVVHIRRFVDNTGAPTGLLGLGGVPFISNSGSQMIAGRAMIIDNAYLLGTSPLQVFGPDPVEKLLAHEAGHALTLPHGDGVDNDGNGTLDDEGDTLNGPNLMQYRFFPPDGISVSVAQGAQVRSQAMLHIPDAAVSTLLGTQSVEQDGPLGNVGTDELGDVEGEAPYLDISEFGAAVDPDKELNYLLASFGQPLPESFDDFLLGFLVDTDDNPETGGDPAQFDIPGVPSNPGVELVGVVNVFKGNQTRVRLFEFVPEEETFVPVVDPSIIAEVVPEMLYRDTFEPGLDLDDLVTVATTVQLQIPSQFISRFARDFRMQVVAATGAGAIVDEVEKILTYETPVFPSCSVEPAMVLPGEEATINTSGMPPSLPVHALLGPTEVARGATDAAGDSSLSFTVPTTRGGFRLVTVGVEDPFNAITADCDVFVLHTQLVPVALSD